MAFYLSRLSIKFFILSSVSILILIASSLGIAGQQVIRTSKPKEVSLTGKEAVEHLKRFDHYDSLMSAFTSSSKTDSERPDTVNLIPGGPYDDYRT